jgi:hypothetical protein
MNARHEKIRPTPYRPRLHCCSARDALGASYTFIRLRLRHPAADLIAARGDRGRVPAGDHALARRQAADLRSWRFLFRLASQRGPSR